MDPELLDTEGDWTDIPISVEQEDHFNFMGYANVLTSRALQVGTPLTIGIYGEWGSGKTSLMRLIQSNIMAMELRGRDRVRTLWINAWRLSVKKDLRMAFLQTLFARLHKTAPRPAQWRFDMHVFVRRIKWVYLARQLIIVLFIGLFVWTAMHLDLPFETKEPDLLVLGLEVLQEIGIPIAGFFLSLWAILGPVRNIFENKLGLDLQALLKDAPYDIQISSLELLDKDFETLIRTSLGPNGRLVVFVDDLDRCTPKRIPEVLEAISLFTHKEHCIYILGFDLERVQKGIADSYEFTSAQAAEYLEKIIQVRFFLPPPDEARVATFIRERYPGFQQIVPTLPEVFSAGGSQNPRRLKRLLNAYRLGLDLHDMWVTAWEADPIEPELLAKMYVIQSRFPELHGYLVRAPSFLLQVEEKALVDGLVSASLSSDEMVGQILLGTMDEPGLIEETSLGALNDLLRTGVKHFTDDDQRDQISGYIYLISAAEQEVRPTRREREALLGGNRLEIEAQVDEILSRGVDEPTQQLIGRAYIERLEAVLYNPARYTAAEQESASIALSLLKKSLLGETPDSMGGAE